MNEIGRKGGCVCSEYSIIKKVHCSLQVSSERWVEEGGVWRYMYTCICLPPV